MYLYLESPKTFFFCVFVFGLIFLRFCSKNAFLEMRTQKKVQSESSSGRVRHGRLKTPFGRKKTRFGRRKKVSGHCLRRICQGTHKKEHFVTYAKKSAFFQKPLFLGKANLQGSLETQGIYRVVFFQFHRHCLRKCLEGIDWRFSSTGILCIVNSDPLRGATPLSVLEPNCV